MAVSSTKGKVSDIVATIEFLTGKQVLVGIPAEGAARTPEEGEKHAPNNATIGYAMEFGLPEQNVPARPFMYPGVEDAKPQIIKALTAAAKAALGKGPQNPEDSLHLVGLVAQRAVQKRITNGPFLPLSKRTLQARKARGRMGERPLLDTGQLRQSVTYVIRTKDSTK